MTTERFQDKALRPGTAAELQNYSQQRMKGLWFRVMWSGVLLCFFIATLTQRLEFARRSDSTVSFGVITVLVLARFGYYIFRLIQGRRDVAAMKHSLGVIS